MIKKISLFFAIVFSFLVPSFVFASVEEVSSNVVAYSPVIFSENYVQVGKKIIFDSSKSVLPENIVSKTVYWKFGDEKSEYGDEVVHDYAKTGTYNVELVKNKFFVVLTEGNIDVVTHGVYQNYKIINPKYILLTRPEALGPVLSIKKIEDIETSLFGRSIEFRHVDNNSSKNYWYVLSTLVNYFIERGVPSDSVCLILIIPFLSFIIIFFRNVVGINTFGLFTPIIVTIAFYILGLPLGLMTFFLAVTVSQFIKYFSDKIEILHLSKVALNLSFISISFLFLIALILKFNLALSLTGAIFPMLVMTTLSEKFMEAKSETGMKSAVLGVLETLLVVMVLYYFMIWSFFDNLLISWPEIVIFPILLTLLLGKFTGLRISEYIRFRSLFLSHIGEEE